MDEFFDEDGYPTEKLLDKIENWEYNSKYEELMQFIKPYWRYSDFGYWDEKTLDKGKEYHISTAGWSGNESIIGALKENKIFWMVSWIQSRRGGHYIFEVKDE
jgi:hypothetical protein